MVLTPTSARAWPFGPRFVVVFLSSMDACGKSPRPRLHASPRPHPEELVVALATTSVSKDEGGRCGAACALGPWFETRRFATLLTMRRSFWRAQSHHEGYY